jgi:hypothetical protein
MCEIKFHCPYQIILRKVLEKKKRFTLGLPKNLSRVFYGIVACRLKVGKSESEQTSIARQRLGDHVFCIIVWMKIKNIQVATPT